MKRRLLLILAAVVRPGDKNFRLIKYSEFPPLSLMTIGRYGLCALDLQSSREATQTCY